MRRWVPSSLPQLSLLTLLFVLIPGLSWSKPLSPEHAPDPLKPWIPWVLHRHEEHRCPFLFNNANERRCAWPSALEVELTSSGGTFRQQWVVFTESYVPLPGDTQHWPQSATRQHANVLILEKDGTPRVLLSPGPHTLSGRFTWDRLPEFLRVPAQTGLVKLTVNKQPVPFPKLDPGGQLWIQKQELNASSDGIKNSLEMQIFRRIIDTVPLEVMTQLRLDVAGEPREVLLGRAVLPQHIPLALDSLLPARVEPDGRLRLQVRPGQWILTLTTRAPEPVNTLTLASPGSPWAEEELWVFDAQPQLRLVELTGLPAVDPQQTNLPQDWRTLPAFRIKPGESLTLAEKRRGDPDPDPDRLTLERTLWLDFAHSGYTVHDQITGTITKQWRLEMAAPTKLGQVTVNDHPQFITQLPGTDHAGVEVRQGPIKLSADSRLDGSISHLPAVGWNHDVHQLSATLHLPPGWTLFSARGPDAVPGTWIGRWTLLDFFLVLVTSFAVARLWTWHWGLITLLTLSVTYHEPGAPQWLWLHLLASTTLMNVLPTGRFKQAAALYRGISLAALVVLAIPFAVQQVRVGLYPQLERPWDMIQAPAASARGRTSQLTDKVGTLNAPQEEAKMETPESPAPVTPEEVERKAKREGLSSFGRLELYSSYARKDVHAHIQTGPGLPAWTWNTITMRWNGPAKHDETLTLLFVPPGLKLFLNLLGVALTFVLLLRLGGLFPYSIETWTTWWKALSGGTASVVLILSGTLLLGPASSLAADLPSDTLLKELETRLLEPPDCLPQCAQVPHLHLTATPHTLRLRLEVHAQETTAVPLPGHLNHWLPAQVVVNGTPTPGLQRDSHGTLWLQVVKGTHQVQLEGPLPRRKTVQLPLPLPPHRTTAQTEGWKLDGLHENGTTDPQLQLTQASTSTSSARSAALEPGTLPPFVRIERILLFDVDWRVETTVQRVSPLGSAVVLEIPLLPGESVTTEQIRVKHNRVLLNLGPTQSSAHWQSLLTPQTTLTLKAAPTHDWVEVWKVQVSPLWHPQFEGIPMIHPAQPGSPFVPEWRPWPGELLALHVTKPIGIEGATLTIDQSHLTVKPGNRATDVTLALTLRSSQGGQHQLTLPEDIELERVTIDGATQPIRPEGRTLRFPIHPGTQQIQLSWREARGLGTRYQTSAVDLGTRSVNATIDVAVPHDRWLLFTRGPAFGPAVLFWGLLLIIALVAVGLGQIPTTPLTARHWALLGIGLSQIPIEMSLIVVGWLLALGARAKVRIDLLPKRSFNLMQIGLGLLTAVALLFLVWAIQQGLLGTPDMQISGNASHASELRWYQDHVDAELPHAGMISTPVFIYRLLMLGWSLWLANALLRWLKWGWACFTTGGYWRPIRTKALPA